MRNLILNDCGDMFTLFNNIGLLLFEFFNLCYSIECGFTCRGDVSQYNDPVDKKHYQEQERPEWLN